ncbi:MAG: heavy metal transport/detoxification protein [Conexibacter sp.]|nr:heavy metal transport/detoxification protein [Conexibacter sp.]
MPEDTPGWYLDRMSPTPRQYVVDGMTCEHCTASVTEEVAAIAGVQDVRVDLPSGRLTVIGEVDDDAVRAAVGDAGYRLVA